MADKPRFIAKPAISGAVQHGNTLCVIWSYVPGSGPWPTVEYLWLADNESVGHEAMHYTMPEEVGKVLTCTVTLSTDEWICAATSPGFGPIE